MESVELREWQKNALRAFRAANNRGIVEVATGGGKTLFALRAFSLLRKAGIVSELLVVVPTLALQDQWYVDIQEDLQIEESEISVLDSRSTDTDLRIANLVVINSARDLAISPGKKSTIMLVVDECHRAGSPENSRAIEGSWASTLGLSATPERQYDDGMLKYLEPSLGPRIFTYTVKEAIDDGVLSRFRLRNIEVPLLASESKRLDSLTRKIARAMSDDSDPDVVRTLLTQRARAYNGAVYRVPTTVTIMEQHRGERTLIFHESIERAEEISAMLSERGHSVALYHSKIAAPRRRENLRLFRKGVIDVLVTCRALDEGANIPETRVAIISASTASTRQRIQRLGRVLRPAPGKSIATVYSLFATRFERERLERETRNLEGLAEIEWLRVTDGE